MKGVFLVFLSFFLFLLLACSTDKKDVIEPSTNSKKEVSMLPKLNKPSTQYVLEKRTKIHAFFRKNMEQGRFNGTFLVAKNGHILYERYLGFSHLNPPEKMLVNTPLHVASVSKVATALAVLRLVDQQKIKLDEDIRTYLPEIPYEGVTVRMLLNHRSGIPYYGYFTFEKWDLGKTLHNEDILRLLQKHQFPLNFPPGKRFAYCNTNYALLAIIVERTSYLLFPDAMKSLVFDPLGMKNSFILSTEKQMKEVAPSYLSSRKQVAFDYLDAVYGDKNLYTTPRDLMRMDLATYSKDFLSDSLREQMFRGYSYEKKGKANYGLGIRMKEEEGKDPYFFHTGWWHGSTSCYASLRSDTVCVVAISNVFNRSVYRINRLANLFGNYPFSFEEQE